MGDINENININQMKNSLDLAETLARVNMLTPPGAKARLAARFRELQFGSLDEDSGDFIPPKQVLLYLVR